MTVKGSDNFADAPSISPGEVSASTPFADLTMETGEPSPAGASYGRSAWWKLTPEVAGTITFDLLLTPGYDPIGDPTWTPDTYVAVYRGDAVDSLTLIAFSDHKGSDNYGGVTSAFVEAGVTYHIQATDYTYDNPQDYVLRASDLALFGPPTTLDSSDSSYYSDAARVWDDVALVAWTSAGRGTVAWEACAVRWTPDLIPETGTALPGPAVPKDGYLGWVGRLTDGIGVIVLAQPNDYTDPAPPVYYLVQVDQETLAVTLLEAIRPPISPWQTNGYSMVVEGENRVGVMSGRGGYSVTKLMDYCAITWDGNFYSYAHRQYDDASWVYDTITVVDMGDYFLRIAKPGSGIEVYQHADEGGLPASAGTLVASAPEVDRSQWEYDQIYACRVGLKAYIFEGFGGSRGSRIHVLDPADWSITTGLWVDEQIELSDNFQSDYLSIEPMFDQGDDKALVAWQQRDPAQGPRGSAVGVFDGSDLQRFVLRSYRAEDNLDGIGYTGSNSWCGVYLGQGRVLGIHNEAVSQYRTVAIAALLSAPEVPEAPASGLVNVRRRFT